MKKMIIFFLIWLISVVLFSQTFSFDTFLNRSNFSFLNSNKISMHHSFSFVAQTFSRKSFYFSDYTNHLNFNLSPKLNFKMNLHFINGGNANFNHGFSNLSVSNSHRVNVIPEFILNYSPSKNFHIQIHYNGNIRPQTEFYNSFNSYYFR